MAARYCVECGNLVTTAFCPSCGAIQPTGPSAGGEQDFAGWRTADGDQPTGRLFDPDEPDADDLPAPPTTDWDSATTSTGADSSADPASEQPWHPFEQPSWYPEYADPRSADEETVQAWNSPPPPTDAGPDFMGISRWQSEPPPPNHQRRNWLLGALAAIAVVAVIVAIAFIVIRSRGNDTVTPDQGGTTTTQPTTALPNPVDPGPTAAPPAVTVTITGSGTGSTTSAGESPSEPATSATAADNPMGGPDRDIACGPGFVVQVASGVDEASFQARVAELRAAGQLPAEVFVARTATSCPIFSGQRNTIVLYAGPFTDVYAGCGARLSGAPDSFIKGTTPDTARQYVSCLCPAQIITVPTFSAVGQTGVWVGELQRVLANKLNYQIPDLAANWGVFTQSTSDAVKAFQAEKGLPATGQVDASTWQALQAAQC